MQPPAHQGRIERIFGEALGLDQPARAAFLDSTCGNDPELRRQVESLLLHGAMLPTSDMIAAAGLTAPPPDGLIDHPPREHFGPYELGDLLGEGGMGSVYRAEQRRPIRRTVAIKLIKPGFDSREVIARFEGERQALAMMDHPGIARVIDAGTTEQSRPFFVLEYVPGQPITRFAVEQQLTIEQRLRLFLQVCDAIAHAHTKAIIHRDIKPSNVLAFVHDGKPAVKVIDFGIAKALTSQRLSEVTVHTSAGAVIGTYDSMSPEQAAGSPDIDTGTDVYSLGVLLYELLAGVKPFDSQTLKQHSDEEVRRIIREVDPPRPSTRVAERAGSVSDRLLAKQLRRELEWIPLKAMRKERQRRYASVQQLAADVENYLEDKPLVGGPESKRYRLTKFISRHRAGVAASAVMLLLLLAGIMGTSMQAFRASRAEHRTAEQLASVHAVNEFLNGMLSAADPSHLLGEKVTVLAAMQSAIKRLDAGELKDQPAVEASVRDTIGKTLFGLGRYDDAAAHLRLALEIRQRALPDNPVELANQMVSLAETLHAGGKMAEAEPLYRRALEIYRVSPSASVRARVSAVRSLGYLLYGQGKSSEAEPLLREALELSRRNLPPRDQNTITSLTTLGAVLGTRAQYAEAERLLREALDLQRADGNTPRPLLAGNLANLGGVVAEQSRNVEAEPLLREALAIQRQTLPAKHPDIAATLTTLGQTFVARNDPAAAEPLFREALDIRRAVLPAGHTDIAQSSNNLASVLERLGRTTEASQLAAEASKTYGAALPPEHPDIAINLSNQGGVLMRQGKYDQAEPLIRRALAIFRKSLPAGHPLIGGALNNLGYLLCMEKKYPDAELALREAVAILTQALPATDPRINISVNFLADSLGAQGKREQAEAVLLAEWSRISALADAPAINRLAIARRFVRLYEAWNKPEEASRWRADVATLEASTQPSVVTQPAASAHPAAPATKTDTTTSPS